MAAPAVPPPRPLESPTVPLRLSRTPRDMTKSSLTELALLVPFPLQRKRKKPHPKKMHLSSAVALAPRRSLSIRMRKKRGYQRDHRPDLSRKRLVLMDQRTRLARRLKRTNNQRSKNKRRLRRSLPTSTASWVSLRTKSESTRSLRFKRRYSTLTPLLMRWMHSDYSIRIAKVLLLNRIWMINSRSLS